MSVTLNTPVGFIARKQANGGIAGRLNRYYIAGALASNIYRGSAVKPTVTSKNIDVAIAGDRLIGVFHGCNYIDASGNVQFRPYWGSGQTIIANSLAEADIVDDPNVIFSVQVSGAAGLALADIGAFADLVIGTGSTATGNSADQLDQTTIGTGTVFRIEELDSTTANNFGQYAKALVRITKHYLGAALTAI
jgi:hypothetical protein